MAFKRIDSFQDYKTFVANMQDHFGCIEDWEYFFDFHLQSDDDGYLTETLDEYQGEIGYCPESFPCVLYCLFDESKDRLGPVTIRIFDWVTFDELGVQ